MTCSDLEMVACKYVLGLILPRQLPSIAEEAVGNGVDSPSLWRLVEVDPSDRDSLNKTLKQVLAELGIVLPSRVQAVARIAVYYAKMIINDEISPYQGAMEIWNLHLLIANESQGLSELHPFVYAASEWDERPSDRGLFEDMILAAANDLARSLR